jgi:chitinase
VDWEQPSCTQDGQNFLALLANIRIYLPDDRYMLTAAVPAGQWALKHIDLAKAADYLDLINVMAYDFAGPWSRTAGYHSQLYPANPGEPSGSAAIDYIISTGFPSKKILLGVPVYGRSFLGAIAPGQAYHGNAGDEGTFEYKSLPRPGTAESVDRNACSAYCIGGDGGFVSYDNTETVRTKGGYCRDKQLGVRVSPF